MISKSRLLPAARTAFRISAAGVLVAVQDGTIARGGLAFSFGYADGGLYMPVLDEVAGTLPEGPFAQTAIRKNELTARYRLPTHLLQAQYPELLEDDDTQWEGSAFDDMTGLAVACSAASGRIDRAFAEATLAHWLGELGNENAGLLIMARAAKTPSLGKARSVLLTVEDTNKV